MKIGILGCRGIPNNYGGFEQFTEYFSRGLVEHGHDVWVYTSNNHPYKNKLWRGVHLIHCADPEDRIGTFGQVIYDLICILDSRKRDFDIILQLGYSSNSIWQNLMPKGPKIVTNMDGMEWQRSKYNRLIQRFIKYTEKLSIKRSDLLIADSEIICAHILDTYKMSATYIPYGADVLTNPNAESLMPFGVIPQCYYLLIARIQSDNHIEEIIKGVSQSETSLPLLIIGNTNNRHGKRLRKEYSSEQIRFLGAIYNKEILDQLRYHTAIYFHGHSVGGTNPSLLEAMASSAPICAHDNPFNRSVLGLDAFYFNDSKEIVKLLNLPSDQSVSGIFIKNNIRKIEAKYTWKSVITSYETAFNEVLSTKGKDTFFRTSTYSRSKRSFIPLCKKQIRAT